MRWLLPLLALLCAATACGRRTHDVPDAFRWEEEVAPGTTIHLRTLSGGIEVTPAAGRSARVAGSTHWVGRQDPVHFAWTREGSDIYVCALWTKRADCTEDSDGFARSGHSWLDMFSLFKRRPTNVVASLRLALPAGVKVDARATNGTITLRHRPVRRAPPSESSLANLLLIYLDQIEKVAFTIVHEKARTGNSDAAPTQLAPNSFLIGCAG